MLYRRVMRTPRSRKAANTEVTGPAGGQSGGPP
jgi:hypothetical protein